MKLPRRAHLLLLLLSGFTLAARAQKIAETDLEIDFKEKIEPLLQDYCYDCHGDGADKGDFTLDEFDSSSELLDDQKVWLRIWENVRTEMMPPSKKKNQPSAEERATLISWIEEKIFDLDDENPDPGRVTIRRMNREEYQNSIADLMGVAFSANDNFPADDTGFGFDTIGDVLTISPLLMEKYLTAAEEIAWLALPEDAGKPKPIVIDAGSFRDSTGSQTGRFMEANVAQTVIAKRALEHSGDYELEVSYTVQNEGGRPKNQAAKWQLMIDGNAFHDLEFHSETKGRHQFTKKLELPQGEHRFELSIVPTNPGEGKGTTGLRVEDFRLKRLGVEDQWDLFPESYQRIFIDGLAPRDPKAQAIYLRKIIDHFSQRALRRPPRPLLVDQLTELGLRKIQEEGSQFVDGVRLAITAILTSPSFIFRSEIQAEPNNPGRVVNLDEYALASRLSYFLWSSLPDQTLLELARDQKLRLNLREQVDRMLADERSERMIKNFVGQWLQARDLEGLSIDTRHILKERSSRNAARIFNSGTRQDMKKETEEFFRHVVIENRPLLELLNADYSFLNERLATFYGVENVRGNHFRKVHFGENAIGRGGLLGQGTFLIVTSQSTRTSPVKRGLFVLDNILGTPAPPAPPDVPELEEVEKKLHEGATMRQLMEIHREKALCASCHERMDPIGLALENFNALGQWRDQEDGKEIESAGRLVTGEEFSNVMELKNILATSRKDDFYRCLTEKMLTYALGRGVEYYDAPTVKKIMSELRNHDGGMKNLIYAIVESVPFQKRRGDGAF